MEKNDFEKELIEIKERISKLEEENDILKIELGNSVIEKYRLEDIKKKFVQDHIKNNAILEKQINEEVEQMQGYIDLLKAKCNELEKENRILLSKCSTNEHNEILK